MSILEAPSQKCLEVFLKKFHGKGFQGILLNLLLNFNLKHGDLDSFINCVSRRLSGNVFSDSELKILFSIPQTLTVVFP